ncbi:MAG: hypothetical protein AB4290_28310 [Spirulina sp.]
MRSLASSSSPEGQLLAIGGNRQKQPSFPNFEENGSLASFSGIGIIDYQFSPSPRESVTEFKGSVIFYQ